MILVTCLKKVGGEEGWCREGGFFRSGFLLFVLPLSVFVVIFERERKE